MWIAYTTPEFLELHLKNVKIELGLGMEGIVSEEEVEVLLWKEEKMDTGIA